MSEPMSPQPPSYSPPPPPPPPGPGAAQRVQGPAIGLIVTGAIGILFGLWNLLSTMVGFGMPWAEMGDLGPGAEYVRWMTGGVGAMFAVVSLLISGFVIWAALQMKELKKWNLAVVASILAMIPCIGPCCVIGIPIGIWALIVLMKPEVKNAFTP